ncbi:MAG: hypothetical protein ACYCOX_02200 [Acidobacteriaceae bacterium]
MNGFQVRKKQGGARANAGRKPKPRVLIRKASAEAILSGVNETELWHGLLSSEDEKITLEALKYLTNRRDGLPAQSIFTKDVSEHKPLAVEYIQAINLALGYTGKLEPLKMVSAEPEKPLPILPILPE